MIATRGGKIISSKKYYKSWNIKGIAESVIKDINENGEEIDNVLDYYLQDTYWSAYSRDTRDARIVVELVKQYIEDSEN
jgi:hypothetical protein